MTAFNLYLARFVTPQYTLSGMIADAPRFTVPPVTEPRTSAMTPPTSALTGAARYDAQDLIQTSPLGGQSSNAFNSGTAVSQGGTTRDSFNETWKHYATIYSLSPNDVTFALKEGADFGSVTGDTEVTTHNRVGDRFARFMSRTPQSIYFTTIREDVKTHGVIYETVRVAR